MLSGVLRINRASHGENELLWQKVDSTLSFLHTVFHIYQFSCFTNQICLDWRILICYLELDSSAGTDIATLANPEQFEAQVHSKALKTLGLKKE